MPGPHKRILPHEQTRRYHCCTTMKQQPPAGPSHLAGSAHHMARGLQSSGPHRKRPHHPAGDPGEAGVGWGPRASDHGSQSSGGSSNKQWGDGQQSPGLRGRNPRIYEQPGGGGALPNGSSHPSSSADVHLHKDTTGVNYSDPWSNSDLLCKAHTGSRSRAKSTALARPWFWACSAVSALTSICYGVYRCPRVRPRVGGPPWTLSTWALWHLSPTSGPHPPRLRSHTGPHSPSRCGTRDRCW